MKRRYRRVGLLAETGEPVVTVIPYGEVVVVEALVLGRDTGVVLVRDRAVVKLKAYPFTRYGTPGGEVIQVSPGHHHR